MNIAEILRYCPKGTKLYCTLCGNAELGEITNIGTIVIRKVAGTISTSYTLDYEGRYSHSGECVLFPSKDQRDWSKFTAPWYKKDRFDPKTLKAFDRVIVYGKNEGWFCSIFSHIGEGEYPYNTASGNYAWCILYNDDTKHLVGTTDEAPEYYRYWEE